MMIDLEAARGHAAGGFLIPGRSFVGVVTAHSASKTRVNALMAPGPIGRVLSIG
jgi:hypothetical protein